MAKIPELNLDLLDARLVVCRLSPSSSLPSWAFAGPFVSISKTEDELSIVTLDNDDLPADIQCERNWRCFKLQGPFAFDLTGILTSILNPLAQAHIGIFAVSTFDTDYVMVKEQNLQTAIDVLKQNGHSIRIR